jgi:hypothetical protein
MRQDSSGYTNGEFAQLCQMNNINHSCKGKTNKQWRIPVWERILNYPNPLVIVGIPKVEVGNGKVIHHAIATRDGYLLDSNKNSILNLSMESLSDTFIDIIKVYDVYF